MRSAALHGAVLALFGVLAVLFTWPLPQRLSTIVLGGGPGDNLAVIWNFWWARQALAGGGLSLFWTPDLFAPIGTSLLTHTLTPLLTVTAALLPWQPDLVVVYNVALMATVFLNFAVTYATTYAITRDRLASVFAAIAFGAAPFLLVRLWGHLNLLSAWGLPLILLATLRYEREPGTATALALAGALGLVAYTDYYYLIFGTLLAAVHLVLSYRVVLLRATPVTPRRRRLLRILAGLIGLVGAGIVWISATGGADTIVGGIRLRMTDTFNPRVALGFLVAAVFLAWKRPRISVTTPTPPLNPVVWRRLPVVAVATALVFSPVLVLGARLWLAGDYASQVYFWRSAPPGIDIATLVLGNPIGFAPGPWTTTLLERLEINRMEGTAWLGLAPLALLVLAFRRLRTRPDAQVYFWTAGVFFVWALGPYLRVFGANTAFMLPQTFLRFVPGLANARIPGRAFVVVQLMVAVLGALALASLRRSPRGTIIGVGAVLAVVLECWPRPHPFMPVEPSALYRSLKDMPPGVVLEVPVGIADGMGTRGAIDYSVLFNQTLHEHPQVGGTISRMSPRTSAAFDADPIVGPLLDLSEGRPTRPPVSGSLCRASLACGVRYVVVAEDAASDALQAFVAGTFALRPLARENRRVLYRVEHIPACDCESSGVTR